MFFNKVLDKVNESVNETSNKVLFLHRPLCARGMNKMWTTLWLLFAWFVGVYGVESPRRKVCVIGAGASGLFSLKQFVKRSEEFEAIAFEKNSEVGGLWIYTDSQTLDEHGLPVHSSMYKHIRTNSPKEIMATPDYREFNGDRSSVTHQEVLQYLKNYTDHFNLRPHIQLNTLVEKVTPILGDGDWRTTRYIVKTRNLNTYQTAVTTCDAVSVCNGHYFQPHLPTIINLDSFPGLVIHSHIYREPQHFADQTVVVLGASLSGIDISIDVARYANTIYISHNKPILTGRFPDNVIQVAGVIEANGSELILTDGSSIKADAMIFCTGYEYSYTFLDKSSGIEVVDNHVHSLYKHMINIEHPSMAFVGIPILVLDFSMFYVQSQYFVSLLQGKVKLPSRQQMLEDSKRIPLGKSVRYAHFLGPDQWAYFDDLAKEGQFELLPKFYKYGALAWNAYRSEDIMHFKEANLIIYDNGSIELVRPRLTDKQLL